MNPSDIPYIPFHISLRRYEEINIFDIKNDESYVIDDESYSVLKLIDNNHTTDQILTEYQENKKEEALKIFKEIEAERPGMWDIRKQIGSLETSFEIAGYIESGREAFLENQWDQVIDAYENALSLDPTLNEPLMNV